MPAASLADVVVLDASPLGLVTNPKPSPAGDACNRWLRALLDRGVRVILPEIVDYEVRRELLRAGKSASVARLDALRVTLEYLPLTTEAMRQAAAFWAQARNQGQPTASDKALDGDVILAAQAVLLGAPRLIVATTNVGHLSRFVAADLWQNIT